MMKDLSSKQVAWWTLIGTTVLESLTALFRFGLGLQSTRDTAATVGALTGGVRIHHGYYGIVLVLVALALFKPRRAMAQRLLIIGLSLIFSDLIHHFVVLWIVIGDPEFHLVYP